MAAQALDLGTDYRKDRSMPPRIESVALIGSYLPRQCGIATFTADLAAAILDNDPSIDCIGCSHERSA